MKKTSLKLMTLVLGFCFVIYLLQGPRGLNLLILLMVIWCWCWWWWWWWRCIYIYCLLAWF